MLVVGEFFGAVLFLTLVVIAVRVYFALRREASVRHEFSQSSLLDVLVLLCPFAPLAFMLAPGLIFKAVVFTLSVLFFVGFFTVAAKQRVALERAGTSRVSDALEATSSATLGAIMAIICIVLAGMYTLLVHALMPPSFGA